jgi:DNA-binding response OmpR family regulator
MNECKQILIVEADVDFAGLLSTALKARKHSVALAGNGADAIALAKEQEFDTCFLDFMMPDMHGLDCLQKIKKLLPEETLYVMMTSFSEVEDLAEADKMGVGRVLFKPFDIGEFVKCTEVFARL